MHTAKKIARWFKRPIGVVVAVIILGAIVAFAVTRGEKSTFEYITVARQDVRREINVTGRVKPARSVELAFERSGRVLSVHAQVGSRVSAGQILVKIDGREAFAQLEQARADLAAEEARLAELQRGARAEEVAVQEVKVANAKAALSDARQDVVDKVKDSLTRADDAVRNKADQMFDNPRSANPKLKSSITTSYYQTKSDVEMLRLRAEELLVEWEPEVISLTALGDIEGSTATARSNLNEIKSLLDKLSLIVNSQTAGASLTQTTIDTWRADISSARTSINTALVNLSSAENAHQVAKANLALAQEELTLKISGPTAEQLAIQQAKVSAASANVINLSAQASKYAIVSPIAGTVTRQDVKEGQIVAANSVVVSVISASKFEIESNVPEADIANLEVGDEADVTLDAYGRDVLFRATVVKIDPAETIIDGVPTYKTTLQFEQDDERVRSGMTANIDILTAEAKDVLAVPYRAVTGDEQKFLKVLVSDREWEEREVVLGLRGSDGMVEVKSGINEGDRVVTFIK